MNLNLDLNKMREKLGQEYILLLRMHSFISDTLDLSLFQGFAFDFSKFQDINSLYLVSDVLITDYSSVFFDYAILNRPMVFFTYDIETYREKLRGFYFDIEKEAPGAAVRTTEDVIGAIQALNEDIQINQEFIQRFCYLEDGQASKRS